MRLKEIQRLKSLSPSSDLDDTAPSSCKAQGDKRHTEEREDRHSSSPIPDSLTADPLTNRPNGSCQIHEKPSVENVRNKETEKLPRHDENFSFDSGPLLTSNSEVDLLSSPANFREEGKDDWTFYSSISYEGYPSLHEWAAALSRPHEMSPARPERLGKSKTTIVPTANFDNIANTKNDDKEAPSQASPLSVSSSFLHLLHKISNLTSVIWHSVLNNTLSNQKGGQVAILNNESGQMFNEKDPSKFNCGLPLNQPHKEAEKTKRDPTRVSSQIRGQKEKERPSPFPDISRTEEMYKFFEKHKKESQKP